MLAMSEDRFLQDSRQQLSKLHETLMTELIEAKGKAALQAKLLVELRECEEALKRIDIGSFGRCQHCGEAVELNLLKGEPTTRFCLSCNPEI